MTKRRDAFNPHTGELLAHLPNISLNCTIIAFHEKKLKVLLNTFRGFDKWFLPGGFVRKEEDLNDAISRIFTVHTGLRDVFMKQFAVFGDLNRLSREESEQLCRCIDINPEKGSWLSHRFMAIAYYAFVKHEKVSKLEKKAEEDINWFAIDELPPLYGDHQNIIKEAIQSMRLQLGYIPVGYELLPPKFTMPELRIIYETILGRELDRRNFKRKVLSTGCVYPLNERKKVGAHKSPNLYGFDAAKYQAAKEEGFLVTLANM